MSTFLAFIQSLPELLSLAVQFMSLCNRFVDWAQKKEIKQWMASLESAIDGVDKAITQDEKKQAARDLSAVLNNLS